MPKVYIMCGLPFSGKTTLSKKIAESLNIYRVSFDDMWLEVRSNADFPGLGTEGWKYVTKKCAEKMEELLRNGKHIIYDNMAATFQHREWVRNIAKQYNAETQTIFMNTPIEEIKKRELINEQTQKRPLVNSAVFAEVLKQFEEPLMVEHALEFHPGMDIERFIEALHEMSLHKYV